MTATTATTATSTASSDTTAASKDSMKSTWRTWDRRRWNPNHWLLHWLYAFQTDLDRPVPVFAKTDKVPILSSWSQHLWILAHTAAIIGGHQALLALQALLLTGSASAAATATRPLPSWAVLAYYTAGYLFALMREVHAIRRLGYRHGYLDGDEHERDGIPDVGVAKVLAAGLKGTGGRMLLATLLTYSASPASPLSLSPWETVAGGGGGGPSTAARWWAWLPLQIGLYGVVLDFWFYLYHRAMHDVPALWRFHRTHHLTKHPNATLTPYADGAQELFDLVGVPFLTYCSFRALGVPLGFYDWFVCQQYITFAEFGGHSGLRMLITPPSTFAPLLRALGAELIVEDHDLHHRRGWRKSHNYGKQTRLWDRVFGTCYERIECRADNVDYDNVVHMPVF